MAAVFIPTRKKVDCPFCEGNGCCFCDHEGKIFVGENQLIKSEEALNSIGVKYLKETDPDEIWVELWEHFLDEKNVPNEFKRKHNYPESEGLDINSRLKLLLNSQKTNKKMNFKY